MKVECVYEPVHGMFWIKVLLQFDERFARAYVPEYKITTNNFTVKFTEHDCILFQVNKKIDIPGQLLTTLTERI